MTNKYFPRHILLPIDGSEHCKRALEWYLKEMRKPSDVIVFVHVIEPGHDSPNLKGSFQETFFVPDLGTAMQKNISMGKELCQVYVELAKKEQVECKAILHVGTKLGQSIVETGNNHNVNVIIIGSRGMGSLQRTFRGSVSDYIIHHSKVPVTVIPPID